MSFGISAPLQKRIFSALVLAPLVLFLVWKGGLFFLGLLVVLAGISLYEWSALSMKTASRAVFLCGGVLYLLVSFWCLYTVRVEYGLALSFLFVAMVWASDIDAYFAGKIIGGPKLALSISPNKTWAGFVAAVASPAVLGGVFYVFQAVEAVDVFSVVLAVVAGGVIGAAGQAGDLLASFLKRKAQVKDSGDVIPGHGGILDRIDSMLLAAPVFLVFVVNFGNLFQ